MMMADWLKSGRLVWFVNGNFDKQVACETAESGNKILNLKPVARQDLHDIRAVNIDSQKIHRLDFPVQDKSNDNSVLMSYFQIGPEQANMRQGLLNKIVMQYMDEPTFNQLRTIE